MKKDHQHTLLSRAKATVTKYNKLRSDKRYHFGDGFRDMARCVHALEDIIEHIETGGPLVRRQQYKVEVQKGIGGGEERREMHESFGVLRISRVQGGSGALRLFGSHLSNHTHTLRLSVYRAERRFHTNRERLVSAGLLPIIEFEMSPLQFADAITSLNMGEGRPCTIRSIESVTMEDLPDAYVPESALIRASLEQEIEDVGDALSTFGDELETILTKKRINKEDRAKIRKVVHDAARFARGHLPFVADSFRTSVAKTVSAAKSEVAAYVTSTLIRAGIASVKEAQRLGEQSTTLLGDGDED